MNIKSFNDKLSSKTLRNILIIIVFAVLIYAFYKKKANEVQQMKEVLMYSREENMKKLQEERIKAREEEIKIKEEAEERTQEIIKDYGKKMTRQEIEDYRVQQLRNIQNRRKAIKKENIVKKANEILNDLDIDINVAFKDSSALIAEGEKVMKNPPKVIPNQQGLYSDVYRQYDNKVKNRTLDNKRKIQREDLILVKTAYSQKTKDNLKNLMKNVKLDSTIENNKDYRRLANEYKQYTNLKNLDFMKDVLTVMKVGYKSPVYDKLVGKTINTKLAIKSNDLLSNFENDQLKQEKINYNAGIDLYKKMHPESTLVFPDFDSFIALEMELTPVDFIDDITVKKYELKENLDNIDNQEERAKKRFFFKEYIKEELKNTKDTR